jgi:hypothetical protein
MKIYYDSLKKSLVNYNTDEVIYREKHDGELDITTIIKGAETFYDGSPYTIEHFIENELEVTDYELIGLNK